MSCGCLCAVGIDRDVGRNEESLDGASIIVLPDNRQYLSDILDTCEVCDAPGC